MKITPDDPRLSAYLLGELDAAGAAEIERATAADPALRVAMKELERCTSLLGDVLAPPGPSRLRETQRRAILRAVAEADAPANVTPLPARRRSWRPLLTGLGAAAAVAVAALITGRVGTPGEGGTLPQEVALLPLPGPEAGTGVTGVASGPGGSTGNAVRHLQESAGTYFGEVARHLESGPLPGSHQLAATADCADFSTRPAMRLPVVLGTGSAVWVRRWIREKGSLPPRDAVRVEELVNSITLPTRPLGQEGFGIGIEELPCPWNPAGNLIAVAIRSESGCSDLEITWESDAPRRVIGSFGRRSDAALPTVLPAGRGNLVLVELADTTADPGILVVKVAGREDRLSLDTLVRSGGPEMRQAVAMAVFGRWLRGEADVDAAMLRQAAETPGDAVWLDTRSLITEALGLAR